MGLAALEAAVRRDMDMLNLPAKDWVPRRAGVIDVIVIGAGMNGIAAAGALIFKGIRNIAVLEESAPGQEGPWVTTARMDTLRSPKALPGPCFGIPSLTFRAWYEASFGAEAWQALYKIHNAT
ncbi:MAG: FAD-dependent oxidoreductase, partial [Alphaproteobacteria bacterium]|nr:FAD-dependent oxidoreductase [Alphaproteobacteria bacterium]